MHDDSERSLASLARAYYKVKLMFLMASATFCNFETIIAVIKVVIETFFFYKSISIDLYIPRTRASEAIERVLKWIVFTLYSTNNSFVILRREI